MWGSKKYIKRRSGITLKYISKKNITFFIVLENEIKTCEAENKLNATITIQKERKILGKLKDSLVDTNLITKMF